MTHCKVDTCRGIHKIEVLIILSVIGVLAAILYPNFMNSAARGPMMGCQSNLKNLSAAIELFSEEHEGVNPQTLAELTPKYLDALPLCQDLDTYSSTYRVRLIPKSPGSNEGRKAYSIYCRGDNHSWYLEPNMPIYDSEDGVKSRIEGAHPFAFELGEARKDPY